MSMIGWLPFIVAVSLVGIVVVQPITGVGLIVTLFASHILLNEKISLLEVFSAGLLIIAPILITFAGVTNVRIDLFVFIIPFAVYFLASLIFSLICFLLSKRKQNMKIEAVSLTGVILNANAIIFTNIITQALNEGDINLFSWFGWVKIVFGIFWFDFHHFWACISLWGILFFFIIGFIFYQSGFQKGKASTMYLIINSLSIIIPIIVGIFIFNQRFENILLFIVAVVIILFADINLSKYQAEIEEIEKIKGEKSKIPV
ncbi:MAG: hypothetical protein GF311_04635 [Candidatus Lokiarchaeota archaeon]|nr:hypothetical protein [Candidatus Lokiarchaeota archaeon]